VHFFPLFRDFLFGVYKLTKRARWKLDRTTLNVHTSQLFSSQIRSVGTSSSSHLGEHPHVDRTNVRSTAGEALASLLRPPMLRHACFETEWHTPTARLQRSTTTVLTQLRRLRGRFIDKQEGGADGGTNQQGYLMHPPESHNFTRSERNIAFRLRLGTIKKLMAFLPKPAEHARCWPANRSARCMLYDM
jgi:hypothetical protein